MARVSREDATRKRVLGVISDRQRLLKRFRARGRYDRPEYLLSKYWMVRGHISKDSWRNIPSRIAKSLWHGAPRQNAKVSRRIDSVSDSTVTLLIHNRPVKRSWILRWSDDKIVGRRR